MRIMPADISADPLDIAESFAEGTLEYAPDVQQKGLLTVRGLAEAIEEHVSAHQVLIDIRLRLRLKGQFELLCARCVESTPHALDENVDLIFRPSGTDAQTGERAITEAETEIGYYEESGLSLDDAVREQVLLSLPERSLCREDCKGLCPHCGTNLNQSSCGCATEFVDPRWSALQGLSSAARPAGQ